MLYASVGFGGGSTYTALLVIGGVSISAVPIISLICNIIVVSGNSVRFAKAGLVDFTRFWPFFALSVPFAWLGGRLPVPQTLFIGLLAGALLFAGISLFWQNSAIEKAKPISKPISKPASLLIGAVLGLLSGIVGIGGGIFLAPILHFTNWGRAKQIAALCSLFILFNSGAGLLGQIFKHGANIWPVINPYIILLPMVFFGVFFGGLIGNHLSIKLFSEKLVRRLTALLILLVGVRLGLKFFSILLS